MPITHLMLSELWLRVADFLEPHELAAFSRVCREARILAGDQQVWRAKCLAVGLCEYKLPRPIPLWRDLYRLHMTAIIQSAATFDGIKISVMRNGRCWIRIPNHQDEQDIGYNFTRGLRALAQSADIPTARIPKLEVPIRGVVLLLPDLFVLIADQILISFGVHDYLGHWSVRDLPFGGAEHFSQLVPTEIGAYILTTTEKSNRLYYFTCVDRVFLLGPVPLQEIANRQIERIESSNTLIIDGQRYVINLVSVYTRFFGELNPPQLLSLVSA